MLVVCLMESAASRTHCRLVRLHTCLFYEITTLVWEGCHDRMPRCPQIHRLKQNSNGVVLGGGL